MFSNCARAIARTLISRLRNLVELLFLTRYVVVTTGAKKIAFTHDIAENIKWSILSFHFIHVFLCFFCFLFSGFEANIYFLVL